MTAQGGDDDHPARRLGRKLKEARIAAGYASQEEFGAAVNMDRTGVSRIENGRRHIPADVLRRWCELCHVDYELYEASARLAWVAEASPVPVWFEDFYRAQKLAHTIRTWHPIIIPGPLQTPDYARALYEATGTPDDLIEERIAARIDLQQQTIERRPAPVKLVAVMDEAVIYRRVGADDIMHGQLMHVADLARRKHIGIQVVPSINGGNAGHVGGFTIASLDDGDVMLMEALEDVTTDKRPVIKEGFDIFDRVRWGSLSGPESLELIMKAADSWKP
jgi:transcriptional regulator with XRE-family HTH domain